MGATASFVSPKGLIVTNHHVAFGAVQRISTAEKNYIENGFLARSLEEEVPAPGYQAYVLLSTQDVTKDVLSAAKKGMTDYERYMAIEKKTKEIIKKVLSKNLNQRNKRERFCHDHGIPWTNIQASDFLCHRSRSALSISIPNSNVFGLDSYS